jgi:hypothetical protein
MKFFFDYVLRLELSPDLSNFRIVLGAITIAFYSSFFLEKKGPKIQASLKANAKAPEKCGAACTIFCALTILGELAPIPPISDCATTLPKAKNHSSASFFLSLVRLAAFRGRFVGISKLGYRIE